MSSPSSRSDRALRRHDLVFVSSSAWRCLLDARPDLAEEPLVAAWIDRGWPLIARRADLICLPTKWGGGPQGRRSHALLEAPHDPSGAADTSPASLGRNMSGNDAEGLPLGLPLPPSHGKRRLALVLPPDALISTMPPPRLRDAISAAPPAWRLTMQRLAELAAAHGGEARIFGSLAWQFLTGLDYVTARSDLDILLPLPRAGDVKRLTDALAAIEGASPVRLDGELVRDDGAGVSWRELHEDAPDLLVKTTRDATLIRADRFLIAGAG